MASPVLLNLFHSMRLKEQENCHRENRRRNKELAKRRKALRLLQSRKRKIMVILMSLVTLILNPPRDRMYWMKPHSDNWLQTADNHFTQEQWYENFRVTKDTFTIILNEIEGEISKQDTAMRKAVPARKKLAMILYYLASTAEYRTIANLFGVSRAFLCNCFKDVCCAIIKNLPKIQLHPDE